MQFFRLKSDFAAHKRAIGVTVGTLIAAGNKDITEKAAPGDYQVKLVPMFESWMSP